MIIKNCICGGHSELGYSDVTEINGDEIQSLDITCLECQKSLDFQSTSLDIARCKIKLIMAWNDINGAT